MSAFNTSIAKVLGLRKKSNARDICSIVIFLSSKKIMCNELRYGHILFEVTRNLNNVRKDKDS